MKKNNLQKILISTLLLLALLATLVGCQPETKTITPKLCINGDIEGFTTEIDLKNLTTEEFTYKNETLNGYNLSDILSQIKLLSDEFDLLITATDGTSAKINGDTASMCHAVVNGKQIDMKAPNHPPVVGIRNIKEITVIAKGNIESGFKILSENQTTYLSLGQVKLLYFEQIGAENKKFDISAYKFVPNNEKICLYDLTYSKKNIVYFDNHDIIKADSDTQIFWENGRICIDIENKKESIFGIVTGTDKIIYDAFSDIKQALDNNKKVMFILPDGLSLKQVTTFGDKLNTFSSNYVPAASVNPAISPVALASIVTGVSPYKTQIYERKVAAPAVGDIFDYCNKLGKNPIYIEGNSKLIVTSIEPKLNVADSNGYTDKNVFLSAQNALKKNPDLLFVHFHGIDDVNHKYGWDSTESLDKILETEEYINSLIADFDGTVIIVPDHGHVKLYDSDKKPYGKHGMFLNEDMLVPYYVLKS